MHSFLHRFFILSFLLVISAACYAQPEFTASAKPSKVSLSEYVTVRYVLKDAGSIKSFRAPSFEHFTIISGPNEESGMSSINGATSQYISLSYIIKPETIGRFSLPGAEANNGKKTYTSNPLLITVTRSPGKTSTQQNNNTPFNPFAIFDPPPEEEARVELDEYILRSNENIAEKVAKNMTLRLETDKTTCYVGEPIVASYNFYTRLKSESKLSKNPSFNGFSVIDLLRPDATLSSIGTLNGKNYNKFTIRKAQLYPLQAGEIQLESATIENDIQFLKESAGSDRRTLRDLRNGFPLSPDALIDQHVSLSSKPVTITVKPLPEVGKPAAFHGAVGSFNITANLQKNSFSTDETGVLTVTVTGNGNLHLVTAPEINWPAGIEAFDPVLNDALDESQVPISGSKTFTYNFTVDNPGEFTIPSIVFPYFDPATKSYHQPSTAAINVNVSKGTGFRTNTTPTAQQDESSTAWTELKEYWWILVAFILILLLILTRSKKAKKRVEVEETDDNASEEKPLINSAITEETIPVIVLRPLEQTEICLAKNDCDNFYTILNKELRHFLASTLHLAPSDLTKSNLETELDKCNIDSHVAVELENLLHEIEWQLYTPSQPGEQLQLIYRRAIEVVETISSKCAENK